jgi:putative ABC transport system permease protein
MFTVYFSLIRTNLMRRKLRGTVTACGVAIAVALSFCLVSFQRGYQQGLKDELDRLGAHVIVVPKGCPYDAASIALHGASWPCYLKSEYLKEVRRTAHVAVAAPVLMTALYDAKNSAQTVYCGVDAQMLALKGPQWRIDGSFPQKPGDLLAGAEVARTNGWRQGQGISLPGIKGPRTGRVCGILRPTQGPDDLFLCLSLSDSQRLFSRSGELTHILVRLDEPAALEKVVAALRGCDAGLEMTVVPLAHLFHTIQNLVQSTRLLLYSVTLVALLTAAVGLSNTILMAVTERTREIGVLRALGATRGVVFVLIWGETMALCLLGGLIGLASGVSGASSVESWLRVRLPFVPHGALLRPELSVTLLCLGATLLLGTAAALLPAFRAAHLSPAESIRA